MPAVRVDIADIVGSRLPGARELGEMRGGVVVGAAEALANTAGQVGVDTAATDLGRHTARVTDAAAGAGITSALPTAVSVHCTVPSPSNTNNKEEDKENSHPRP